MAFGPGLTEIALESDPHSSLEQSLHAHGLRSTRARRAVLAVFERRPEALRQSQIADALEDAIDRATLYRTLRQLEQAGLVHRIPHDDGQPRFARCTDECPNGLHQEEHAHFTCRSCGRTLCITDQPPPEVALPTGFLVENWDLHLSGLCARCRE